MPKLRKARRAQKFRYNVNRKRLNKKTKNVGSIKCPEIKNAWNNRQTLGRNLANIGLASDPNKVIPVPTAKEERMNIIKMVNGFNVEDLDENNKQQKQIYRPKGYVLQQLEDDANALRESGFRLPKGVVKCLSEMMDKHGLNYKAMARDEKNYDQETWKQFRAKIRKFMNVPEQFNEFLKSRNLSAENLDWQECSSDDD